MSNSWAHRGISSTTTTLSAILAINAVALAANSDVGVYEPRWTGRQESNTASSTVRFGTKTVSDSLTEFDVQLAAVYESLASIQKPLAPDFAEILSRNLSDLYAR